MIKKLLFIVIVLLTNGLRAQHGDFQSLYMYDALTINPAYAGNKGALVLNANYRNQWLGLKGAPQTFSFTTHLITKSKRHGLGLIVLNDRFGITNHLRANGVYSYKLNFRKSVLSFGLAAGVREESADRDALNLNNSADASFTNLPERVLSPDVNFGIMYKRENFIAGLSVPNIVKAKRISEQPAANLYVSAVLGSGKNVRFKPSALVKYLVNSPFTYEGNLTLYFGQVLSAGAGFRNDKTGNAHLRLQLNRQFAVAYLYERNFGPYNFFLKSTHEFMLNYTFDYKSNVQSPRYL